MTTLRKSLDLMEAGAKGIAASSDLFASAARAGEALKVLAGIGKEVPEGFGVNAPVAKPDDISFIIEPVTDDMKPCPFCGNTHTLDVMWSESDGLPKWWIECSDCDMSGPQVESTRGDMRDSWNRRPLENG